MVPLAGALTHVRFGVLWVMLCEPQITPPTHTPSCPCFFLLCVSFVLLLGNWKKFMSLISIFEFFISSPDFELR